VSPPRERELKLAVAPSYTLPSFDGIDDEITGTAQEAERFQATYYDTEDLRLARWGITLRYRTNDGWTLKLPDEGGSDFLLRTELRLDGDARRPPEEAHDLVRAYVRGAALVPVARLRTVRRATDFHDAGGELLAQVVDDEVAVLDGRRIANRFRELELELAAGSPTRLGKKLRTLLQQDGAAAVDPTPKVFRALGPPALEPPDVVITAPQRDSTAGAVVRQAIAASVIRLLRHDPVVRLDAHAEGVHQARVATRRLRSDLRTFAPLLDRQWSRSLQSELGWLAGLLGRVRDADVMLARLEERTLALSEPIRRDARPVLRSLRAARRKALADLLEAMHGERYVRLLDRLVDAARTPQLTPRADLPARDELREVVRQPWRSLRRAVGALEGSPTDEDLHGVRIRAKRCRYAAEAAAPVLGKRAAAFADSAAALQDVLGELNDAVVAERWLHEWSSRRRSAGEAFAAGELAGLERALGERSRRRWRRAWAKLDSPKRRSWL
jgi:CHAD domain-containing protein